MVFVCSEHLLKAKDSFVVFTFFVVLLIQTLICQKVIVQAKTLN